MRAAATWTLRFLHLGRSAGAEEAPAPRLVLRFALLTAICLGIAAAAILAVTRHLDIVQAERSAADHARFVATSLLGSELRASDLAVRISAARLAELDQLFEQQLGAVESCGFDFASLEHPTPAS